MSNPDRENQEPGKNIDIKIGSDYNRKVAPDSSRNELEEEILKTLKMQTIYIRQIKNILLFFFFSALIGLVFAFVN